MTWSISPSLGAITGTGLYTAPAAIASAQTVTVTATSVVEPTKSASASISLLAPVSVSAAPAAASLSPSQSQQFTASVTGGSGNTAVTWSINPSVGTITSTGLYTAPSVIASAQTVTVTATSVADPTKSASASISLLAPVSVSATPATASLPASQSQQFTASVTGGSGNTAVTWSINPSVGTITSTGLYTAPAAIASAQTVTVTATSVADPTKSASGSVSLLAPVSVMATPATASLSASQSQQFTASVTGCSGNTAVTWSINSSVGTITSTGLYTAPATISAAQTVTVTATSVADSTKSASATISLQNGAVTRLQFKSGSVSPGTSVTVTLPNHTTARNELIVAVTDYYANAQDGASFAITDSYHNTWKQAVDYQPGSRLIVYYAENITGGANHQITVTATIGAYIIVTAVEYAGLATVNSLDVTATNRASGSTYTSTSATTTQASELLFGLHHVWNTSTAFTPASPWSQIETKPDGSGLHEQTTQDQVVSVVGSYASMGAEAPAADTQSVMVAFKAAGAADTIAPSAPGNLTAVASSSTAINLTWTASTDNVGVTGYKVYREAAAQ